MSTRLRIDLLAYAMPMAWYLSDKCPVVESEWLVDGTYREDKDKDILIPIKVPQGAKSLQWLYNSKIHNNKLYKETIQTVKSFQYIYLCWIMFSGDISKMAMLRSIIKKS
jgi:hypothetical protein